MKYSISATARFNMIEGVNNCSIIYDTHAYDFSTLTAALDVMMQRATPSQSKTVILSDMAHETMSPERLYPSMAQLLKSKAIDRIIGIGTEMMQNSQHFDSNASFYASTQEFLDSIETNAFSDELILIKGGPQFHFERVVEALETRHNETMLEVNLDAVVHNYDYFRSQLKPTTGIMCMVKASGYGAGAGELAKTLQCHGAAYLAVAVMDEALELRKEGITMPIVVLNPKAESYKTMFAHLIEPEIYNFDILQEIIAEAEKEKITNYPIHIKLDTGMHRLGFLEKDIPRLTTMLANQQQVMPKSVFSHLATADCLDMDDYTLGQLTLFERCCDTLQQGFKHHILRHILNSTGILRFPEYQDDMVRLGICLYGMPTIPGGEKDLQPISSLRTMIISIKEWDAGTTIGYSRRGVLTKHSRIATIPIGYADGIDRHLGNGHTDVYVNGHRCPTVGNICMDLCMIDVTGVECEVGDTVEIFGDNIPVMELAKELDTISYEILTSVSPRVKRIYYHS